MGLHDRRLTLVLATLLGVVLVAGAAAAFAVGRAQRVAGGAAHAQTSARAPASSVHAPTPESRPTHSAPPAASHRTAPPTSSAGHSPSASPDEPPSSTPAGPVAVTLSARALASSDAQPVADLLGRYFTAINQHDYDAWLATVSTSQAKRNRDNWIDGYSTTRDEGVYVSDIYRKGSDLLVRIQFVSHQAVDKAPDALPLDCIRWDVTYQVVDEGTGLRVGNSVQQPSMAPCS